MRVECSENFKMLGAIESCHGLGYLHRDVKPSNFAMGCGSKRRKCFVIDFGLSKRYVTDDGSVAPARENAQFRGTSLYASVNAHLCKDLGRRDDLWSLLYVLVEFLDGDLPWSSSKEKERVRAMKEQYNKNPELLMRNMKIPDELMEVAMYLRSLEFQDEPDYRYLRSRLDQLYHREGIQMEAGGSKRHIAQEVLLEMLGNAGIVGWPTLGPIESALTLWHFLHYVPEYAAHEALDSFARLFDDGAVQGSHDDVCDMLLNLMREYQSRRHSNSRYPGPAPSPDRSLEPGEPPPPGTQEPAATPAAFADAWWEHGPEEVPTSKPKSLSGRSSERDRERGRGHDPREDPAAGNGADLATTSSGGRGHSEGAGVWGDGERGRSRGGYHATTNGHVSSSAGALEEARGGVARAGGSAERGRKQGREKPETERGGVHEEAKPKIPKRGRPPKRRDEAVEAKPHHHQHPHASAAAREVEAEERKPSIGRRKGAAVKREAELTVGQSEVKMRERGGGRPSSSPPKEEEMEEEEKPSIVQEDPAPTPGGELGQEYDHLDEEADDSREEQEFGDAEEGGLDEEVLGELNEQMDGEEDGADAAAEADADSDADSESFSYLFKEEEDADGDDDDFSDGEVSKPQVPMPVDSAPEEDDEGPELEVETPAQVESARPPATPASAHGRPGKNQMKYKVTIAAAHTDEPRRLLQRLVPTVVARADLLMQEEALPYPVSWRAVTTPAPPTGQPFTKVEKSVTDKIDMLIKTARLQPDHIQD
eukprot:gene16387-19449_t